MSADNMLRPITPVDLVLPVVSDACIRTKVETRMSDGSWVETNCNEIHGGDTIHLFVRKGRRLVIEQAD